MRKTLQATAIITLAHVGMACSMAPESPQGAAAEISEAECWSGGDTISLAYPTGPPNGTLNAGKEATKLLDAYDPKSSTFATDWTQVGITLVNLETTFPPPPPSPISSPSPPPPPPSQEFHRIYIRTACRPPTPTPKVWKFSVGTVVIQEVYIPSTQQQIQGELSAIYQVPHGPLLTFTAETFKKYPPKPWPLSHVSAQIKVGASEWRYYQKPASGPHKGTWIAPMPTPGHPPPTPLDANCQGCHKKNAIDEDTQIFTSLLTWAGLD